MTTHETASSGGSRTLMTITHEPAPAAVIMFTPSPETDVQLTFTVHVASYGHPDKVRAAVTRDLDRILQLAFHAGAVTITDDQQPHALAAAAAELRSCSCPACDHTRAALHHLESAA